MPIPRDTHSGEGIGSLWIPSPIDPRDESRSYSRTAYHDRAVKRKNYHLLPLTQVTRILFDDHKRAIGVMVLPPAPRAAAAGWTSADGNEQNSTPRKRATSP